MWPLLNLPGGAQIPSYFVMMCLGYGVAVGTALILAGKLNVSKKHTIELFVVLAPLAIFGAKMGHCLLEAPGHLLPDGRVSTGPLQLLQADPWHWARLLDGGYVWYGGLLAGVAGLWLWARWRRLTLGPLVDGMAPGVAFGLAVGRLGCFMSGCCHGAPSAQLWAVQFPHGPAAGMGPVHPVQLYEAAFALALGAGLIAWLPRRRWQGQLLSLALLIYAAGRFGLEMLRGDDERGVSLGGMLSVSQIISLVILALTLYDLQRRNRVIRAGVERGHSN